MKMQHAHVHSALTVKAPVESVEGGLQRAAGLSDQPLRLPAAQSRQVLLHSAGTAGWTLRTHPQVLS